MVSITLQNCAAIEWIREAKLEAMPLAGAEIAALIAELYATPAAVVAKAAEMIK